MQVQQRAQIALMHAIAAVSHAEMNAATGAIATHVVTLDRKLLVWGRRGLRRRRWPYPAEARTLVQGESAGLGPGLG